MGGSGPQRKITLRQIPGSRRHPGARFELYSLLDTSPTTPFGLRAHNRLKLGLQARLDSFKELKCIEVVSARDLLALDEQSKIFRELARLNALDARLLKGMAEGSQLVVVVKLGAVGETAGPRVDRRNRVGRRLLAFLM